MGEALPAAITREMEAEEEALQRAADERERQAESQARVVATHGHPTLPPASLDVTPVHSVCCTAAANHTAASRSAVHGVLPRIPTPGDNFSIPLVHVHLHISRPCPYTMYQVCTQFSCLPLILSHTSLTSTCPVCVTCCHGNGCWCRRRVSLVMTLPQRCGRRGWTPYCKNHQFSRSSSRTRCGDMHPILYFFCVLTAATANACVALTLQITPNFCALLWVPSGIPLMSRWHPSGLWQPRFRASKRRSGW